MKFAPPRDKAERTGRREACAAFTLAEVLAALLFMAIVVPVALQGMHVASLAGAVAQRKGEAGRVAQRVLTEAILTTNWSQTAQGDTAYEGLRQFRWTLRNDPWNMDLNQNVIRQLTVEVFFMAQDREYSVRLSTLVDSTPPLIQ
jgi:type II secretory pathway pseudopilin PulG